MKLFSLHDLPYIAFSDLFLTYYNWKLLKASSYTFIFCNYFVFTASFYLTKFLIIKYSDRSG